jgi:hypothetical protein
MPAIIKKALPAILAYAGVRVAQTFAPAGSLLIEAGAGAVGAYAGLYIANKVG